MNDSPKTAEMFEISIFPIPECVSFPLSIVPLHVFEPRYRVLMKDAIRLKRRIAVCHTKKEIRAAKEGIPLEEMLRTNQGMYEPEDIFSAGFAELIDQTEDGRMIVEIKMDERYQIVDEVQTVPYRVARCKIYSDEPESDKGIENKRLRTTIDEELLRMSQQFGDELPKILQSELWLAQSDNDYSFKIFQFIRLDPDLMQSILEMRSANERLRTLLRILTPALKGL